MIIRTAGLAIALGCGAFLASTAQSANPGQSAESCIGYAASSDQAIFTNNCGQKAFVIYCGELKYTKKRCGDAKKGNYYTHSFNLDPGKRNTVSIKGEINYGSCLGTTGFGRSKWDEDGRGGYRCKP